MVFFISCWMNRNCVGISRGDQLSDHVCEPLQNFDHQLLEDLCVVKTNGSPVCPGLPGNSSVYKVSQSCGSEVDPPLGAAIRRLLILHSLVKPVDILWLSPVLLIVVIGGSAGIRAQINQDNDEGQGQEGLQMHFGF